MHRRAYADLLDRGLTMPADTGLGGLSLTEARQCYAFLLARAELARMCTFVLGCKETVVWYSEPARLRDALARYVSEQSGDAFIELCSYRRGRSPASAPLINDGPLIAIPSALISAVGFERTLLRAASADPSRGGHLGNALGRRAERWADRLRSIPAALVAERLPVRNSDGTTIGDLDVAAFDPEHDLIFAVETKWPVDAQTLRESSKIDDIINAGRRQLLRITSALAEGGIVQWPSGWNVRPTTRIHWWVGTAQQLSSRPDHEGTHIGATSLRLVEHLLPAQSVADLQERLVNFPLPRLGVEYQFVDETVRAGRYRITVPAIAVLGEPPVPPEDRRTNTGWT